MRSETLSILSSGSFILHLEHAEKSSFRCCRWWTSWAQERYGIICRNIQLRERTTNIAPQLFATFTVLAIYNIIRINQLPLWERTIDLKATDAWQQDNSIGNGLLHWHERVSLIQEMNHRFRSWIWGCQRSRVNEVSKAFVMMLYGNRRGLQVHV